MTPVVVALLVGIAIGAGGAWIVCTGWHRAVRFDRDLQEQDAWMHHDAVHLLERSNDRRQAALRYLARLPWNRRVKVMARYCRLIQQETAA